MFWWLTRSNNGIRNLGWSPPLYCFINISTVFTRVGSRDADTTSTWKAYANERLMIVFSFLIPVLGTLILCTYNLWRLQYPTIWCHQVVLCWILIIGLCRAILGHLLISSNGNREPDFTLFFVYKFCELLAWIEFEEILSFISFLVFFLCKAFFATWICRLLYILWQMFCGCKIYIAKIHRCSVSTGIVLVKNKKFVRIFSDKSHFHGSNYHYLTISTGCVFLHSPPVVIVCAWPAL